MSPLAVLKWVVVRSDGPYGKDGSIVIPGQAFLEGPSPAVRRCSQETLLLH